MKKSTQKIIEALEWILTMLILPVEVQNDTIWIREGWLR